MVCRGISLLIMMKTLLILKQHGFEPRTCCTLKSLCFVAASTYCERLETRMYIGIGRSATAYMIADPLAVLDEGEVHIAFSEAFKDEASNFKDTMLNGMEILVARNPAYLPTDIQKVRNKFSSTIIRNESLTTSRYERFSKQS